MAKKKCPSCEGTGRIYSCPGCGATSLRGCNASSMECWYAGNWFGGSESSCDQCDGSGFVPDSVPQCYPEQPCGNCEYCNYGQS